MPKHVKLDPKVDGRRKYAPGTSRMEKRRQRALDKLAKKGVNVALAKEDTRPDKELLSDMINRMDMLDTMLEACARGQIPALIVPGAPGIGKTFHAERKLNALQEQGVCRWIKINGTNTPVEIFKLAFEYRRKGSVIVIDDGDKALDNEESLNLLKAMTDSSKRRVLNRRSNSDTMDGVEPVFEFEGSVVVISNIDFQAYVDLGRGKNVDHMEALISRALYLDLKIHNRRAISLWVTHVSTDGHLFELHNIDEPTGKQILAWLHEHNADLREYSLRTVVKMCNLVHIGSNWKSAALYTLCR